MDSRLLGERCDLLAREGVVALERVPVVRWYQQVLRELISGGFPTIVLPVRVFVAIGVQRTLIAIEDVANLVEQCEPEPVRLLAMVVNLNRMMAGVESPRRTPDAALLDVR